MGLNNLETYQGRFPIGFKGTIQGTYEFPLDPGLPVEPGDVLVMTLVEGEDAMEFRREAADGNTLDAMKAQRKYHASR